MTGRGIGLTVMGLGLLLGAAACGDSTSPDAETAEQLAFIDNIVPHHQMASMMADDAIAKANREGLRTLATAMKADQNREIAQYRAIRQLLVGVDTTPPPMPPEPMPAGPDFDREWLMMMINHHQGAINTSTLAHGVGVRSRLDSLAHHTIEEQRREQQDMRDSLAAWYGS